MALGLDEDVDEGAIVEVSLIELGGHAALVEGAPLFDFFGKGGEKIVVLNPL